MERDEIGMSNISVEKKLELLQQIRSRNQRDRYDMFHRENLVYGRTRTVLPEDMDELEEFEGEYGERFQSFPLRVLLALGLFLMIIVCDMSGRSFLGIQVNQCFNAIAADYESSISAWVDAASSNVSDSDNVVENPPAGSRP